MALKFPYHLTKKAPRRTRHESDQMGLPWNDPEELLLYDANGQERSLDNTAPSISDLDLVIGKE